MHFEQNRKVYFSQCTGQKKKRVDLYKFVYFDNNKSMEWFEVW